MKNLPGSTITVVQAVKKSMIVPISNTEEIKYNDPIIVKCISLEDAIEPGQIIIDSYYLNQKFKVIEILSGNVEKQFYCDYMILIKQKEKPIKKGRKLIIILADDKAEGVYHLIKTLEDNKSNRDEILKSIDKLECLKNF